MRVCTVFANWFGIVHRPAIVFVWLRETVQIGIPQGVTGHHVRRSLQVVR